MGKKRVDVNKFIDDQGRRDVTYAKRKRGIIKKMIELSTMCGQDIFLVIFDKEKQKLVEYRSDPNFGIEIVNGLMNPDIAKHFVHQLYTNEDQVKVCTKKTKKAASDSQNTANNEEREGRAKQGLSESLLTAAKANLNFNDYIQKCNLTKQPTQGQNERDRSRSSSVSSEGSEQSGYQSGQDFDANHEFYKCMKVDKKKVSSFAEYA